MRAPLFFIVFCSPVLTTVLLACEVISRVLCVMAKHKKRKDKSSSRHSRDKSRPRRHSSQDTRHERKARDRSFSCDSENKGRRSFSRSSSERHRGSSRDSSSRRSPADGSLLELLSELRKLVSRLGTKHNLSPRTQSQEGSRSPLPEASQAAGLVPTDVVAHASASSVTAQAVEQFTDEEQTVTQADHGTVPGMSSCRPSASEILLAKRGHN